MDNITNINKEICKYPYLLPININKTINEITIDDCTYSIINNIHIELLIFQIITGITWFCLFIGYCNNLNIILKNQSLKNKRKTGNIIKLEIHDFRIYVMKIGIIQSLFSIIKIIVEPTRGMVPWQVYQMIDEIVVFSLYCQSIIFIGFIINLTSLNTRVKNANHVSKRSRMLFIGTAFISLIVCSLIANIFNDYMTLPNVIKFSTLSLNTIVLFIYSCNKCILLDSQISGSSKVENTAIKSSAIRDIDTKKKFNALRRQFRIKTSIFNICILGFSAICIDYTIEILTKENFYDNSTVTYLNYSYDFGFKIEIQDIAYILGSATMLLQFSNINKIFCIKFSKNRTNTTNDDSSSVDSTNRNNKNYETQLNVVSDVPKTSSIIPSDYNDDEIN